MAGNNFEAKKVFFLYPHSVIQQELVEQLISNEYEVYLIRDHKRLRKILHDFHNPIVFINVDENLEKEEWKEYVSEIIKAEDNNAQIGILTYNEDQRLAQYYLMELMVPCGFIKLKLGLQQSKAIILKTLEANEAKGRRRYLRIVCWDMPSTEFNVKIEGVIYNGKIKDISSVGMAIIFNENIVLKKHTLVSDIQLKLKGKIARVSGPVLGTRIVPEGTVHVIIFDRKTDFNTRDRIHNFVYEALQEQIAMKLSAAV